MIVSARLRDIQFESSPQARIRHSGQRESTVERIDGIAFD